MGPVKKSPNGSKVVITIGAVVLVAIVAAGVYAATRHKTNTATKTDAMAGMDMSSSTGSASTSVNSGSNGDSSVSSTSTSNVTIGITAGSYYFSPKTIKVSKGAKVTINLTTKDMTHNFNIDELGVHIPDTAPGSTNSATFTADKAGSFQYYCSIGQHRQLGQVGTITVE